MPSLAQAGRGLALGAIAGLGIYRPPADAPLARRVTGSDLTGVSYRVQADQGINTASLAAGAARAAMQAGGVNATDIGMIIVGTTTPDVLWPTTACLVQTELKLPMVASFDLYAAETSLLAALNVGVRYIASGGTVLVIGADSDNQLVDLPGQSGTVHSRAAAAAVLTPAGSDGGVLSTMAGGAARPEGNGDANDRNSPLQRGKGGVAVLQGLTDGAAECLRKASLSLSDIDLVIGEQSAPEIMRAWSRAAGVTPARLLLDPARYGSLLAAAPLTALYDAITEGRLQNGMTALLLACGSGPTWAAACVRWGGGGLASASPGVERRA